MIKNGAIFMRDDYIRDAIIRRCSAQCMFDKFHLTFNFRSKISRDVSKNIIWMSIHTYIFLWNVTSMSYAY